MPFDQQTHIPGGVRPGRGGNVSVCWLQEEEEEEEEEGGRGEPLQGFLWCWWGGRQLQRANEVCPAGVLSADRLLPML